MTASRLIGIRSILHDGSIEVAEEVDAVDHLPLYEHGSPFPIQYVAVPSVQTRIRRVWDRYEIAVITDALAEDGR